MKFSKSSKYKAVKVTVKRKGTKAHKAIRYVAKKKK